MSKSSLKCHCLLTPLMSLQLSSRNARATCASWMGWPVSGDTTCLARHAVQSRLVQLTEYESAARSPDCATVSPVSRRNAIKGARELGSTTTASSCTIPAPTAPQMTIATKLMLLVVSYVTLIPRIFAAPIVEQTPCPTYSSHSRQRHEPFSPGAHSLRYMRPEPACRTFNSLSVEQAVSRMNETIYDPDLFRLFENTCSSTLDTAIRWKGVAANNTDEELVFVITGDINAMWIRDSANQIAPYKTVLNSSDSDVINLQARCLVQYHYCNSFNPPVESEIVFTANSAGYVVFPPYDTQVVFTCNFELDDFGAFLQLSHDYYERTGDLEFFGKFQWIYAVQSILRASRMMQQPTYAPNGTWLEPEYKFSSYTRTAFGTLGNNGFSYPVNATGMVRAPFRPSDDAAIFDFAIPANMMLTRYLSSTAKIMDKLPTASAGLAQEMRDLAAEIEAGIETLGIVTAPNGKKSTPTKSMASAAGT